MGICDHEMISFYNSQEPDETLNERLWGLTEMFPDRLRTVCGVMTDFSVSSVQNIYHFSCNASWIFFTSSMILFAPIIFETERANFMESQRAQQKQVSLIVISEIRNFIFN